MNLSVPILILIVSPASTLLRCNNEDGDTLILGTPKDYKAWLKHE